DDGDWKSRERWRRDRGKVRENGDDDLSLGESGLNQYVWQQWKTTSTVGPDEGLHLPHHKPDEQNAPKIDRGRQP
ncbi:hypothetical protein KI387_011316, partial [Taxus chinensis]